MQPRNYPELRAELQRRMPTFAAGQRRIARVLREQGHDVRAADEERQLDGLEDDQLLELVAEETRVMITFDVKDFAVIARRWAEAGKAHAGLGIVVGIDNGEFGTILEALSRELDGRPAQSEWSDLTLFITRQSATDAGQHGHISAARFA